MADPDGSGGFSPRQCAAIALGALAGFAGVAIAAWAAHGAPAPLRPGLTSAAYLALPHGIVLIACGLIDTRLAGRRWAHGLLGGAAAAFASGILLFCGGIVLAALGANPGTQPAGGALLMLGWMLLAASALAAAGRR